jgi:hypothetical protein
VDFGKSKFTPFGQYEWNVMPFGLKNAPSEFQNIMNDILGPLSKYSIVYIDDVLIFSKSIKELLSPFLNPMDELFKFSTKLLFKHNTVIYGL